MSHNETKRNSKKAQTLLQKKGISRKDYSKQLSTLKKQGLVAKRIDARSHKPTRYMLKKIAKFKDVAAGNALAVRVKDVAPSVREKYQDRGVIEQRDKFFIVPKTQASQRAKIVKGHIALYHPLKNGEHRIVFLPYKPEQMSEFIDLLNDKTSEINQMKERTEYFGFQLYGNNSQDGFPRAQEMAKYLRDKYAHILSTPAWNRSAMQDMNFVLIRFKNMLGYPTAEPYRGEAISHIPKGQKKNKRNMGTVEARIKRGYETGRKRRYRARKKKEQSKNPPEF